MTIPAGIVLIIAARGVTATLATSVYVISLFALFSLSAAYHLFARTERSQRVMQRVDHSMVYVLIAGTYTPVCLLGLPRRIGIAYLIVVWFSACAGIVLKVRWKGTKTSAALYLIIGWAIVFAIPSIYNNIGAVGLSLYAMGGLVFTIGAVLFYLQRPKLKPDVFGFHELWHTLTVIAVLLQFCAAAVLITRVP